MAPEPEETAEELPEDATPQEVPIQGRHWEAIHTYPDYENKVKTHLEARIVSMGVKDKIFRVVVPTEDEIEIKGGQRRTVTRKVYPGYVLVDLVLDDNIWHVVRNTPGVTGFVGGTSTEPVPLQENELRHILQSPPKGQQPHPKPNLPLQL